MSDSRPIGVIDSGCAGLGVVRELQRVMPGETVVYIGDTARFPYGIRSRETIMQNSRDMVGYISAHNVKMVIVASNTMSSLTLDQIRRDINEIPVIGTVLPGCKAAVMRTAERKVGVIGTTATIGTNAYQECIDAIDSSIKVYGKACPLFVPLVQEGLLDADITRLAAQRYLYDLVDIGIDCLILGCGHYSLLMEVVLDTVGTRVQLIDSSFWTAREAQDILTALEACADPGRDGYGESQFYVTDTMPSLQKEASRFLMRKARPFSTIDNSH